MILNQETNSHPEVGIHFATFPIGLLPKATLLT